MKSVSIWAFVLIIAAVGLVACGKGGSDAERSYSDTCVKLLQGNEVYRPVCDCEAGIVASKLTPGELKAYLASPDWPKGALNPEALSKFTSDHGFTMAEYSSLGVKMQSLGAETSKCPKAK